MIEVDQQRVAREWRARGFSCDLWVDPPGQVWEDYRHATDELVMLVAGRLELEFDGRVCATRCGRGSPDSSRCASHRQKHRWDSRSMALRVQAGSHRLMD